MAKQRFDAKRVALLSLLTAMCYVGRIIFQFLPNVQPMTAILIILTLHLSIVDGLIVASLSLVLSNFLLGMGPWTFMQLASFSVLILLTGIVMKPLYPQHSRWIFVIFSFLSGMLYGFVISLMNVQFYGIASFWGYYFYGLPFDFAHALGTAGFYLLLEPVLAKLFKKTL